MIFKCRSVIDSAGGENQELIHRCDEMDVIDKSIIRLPHNSTVLCEKTNGEIVVQDRILVNGTGNSFFQIRRLLYGGKVIYPNTYYIISHRKRTMELTINDIVLEDLDKRDPLRLGNVSIECRMIYHIPEYGSAGFNRFGGMFFRSRQSTEEYELTQKMESLPISEEMISKTIKSSKNRALLEMQSVPYEVHDILFDMFKTQLDDTFGLVLDSLNVRFVLDKGDIDARKQFELGKARESYILAPVKQLMEETDCSLEEAVEYVERLKRAGNARLSDIRIDRK